MVKLTIHHFAEGECCLSGKAVTDGVVVSFDDATLSESLLSTKSLLQLIRLKLGVKNSSGTSSASSATPVATPLSD